MSVPLFKDFGKTSSDLLTKGYSPDSFGFELQSKKSIDNSDTLFKVTGTSKSDGQTSNLVEASETWKNKGLTLKLSCKADKTSTYNVELSTKNKFLDGLNLTFTSKFSDYKNDNEVKATYGDNKYFNAELIGTHSSKPTISGNIVAAYESLKVGVSGTASVSKSPSLSEYSLRLGYFPSCCTYGFLFFDSKNENIAGSRLFYRNSERKLQSSIEVSVKTNRLGETPKITTAFQYDVDKNTTLKSRFSNTNSTVDVSVKQILSDTVSATVSSEFSELSLSGGVKGKFGLLLNVDI